MSVFHKMYLSFAFIFTSVVYPQSQYPPSSTPLPLPYISYQGCDVFAGYSTDLRATCRSFEGTFWDGNPVAILIINHGRGTDISEAGDHWLILVDGSDGTLVTTQARSLSLSHRQYLLGVVSGGQNPVLSFSASSPAHLIDAQEADIGIFYLQLEGINSGINGTLLYIKKTMASHISHNLFNTTPVKSIAIHINDDQDIDTDEAASATCGFSVIGENTFNVSASSLGIRLSCFHGKEVNADLIHNQFNLRGDSTGLHIIAGGLYSTLDTFTQTAPAPSYDQPPVAILFDPGVQTENNRLFHDSLIRCATFNGGSYGELVPVVLADFFDGDGNSSSQVTIAHNIFRNVPVAVRAYSASQTITTDSICNIWINDAVNNTTTRCPAVLPNNGFLHFADGVTCGSKPENFVEPDCIVKRQQACLSSDALTAPTMRPTHVYHHASQPTETMTLLFQNFSDNSLNNSLNNSLSKSMGCGADSAEGRVMAVITLLLGYFFCLCSPLSSL